MLPVVFVCTFASENEQHHTMSDDRIIKLISESLRNGEKENISFQITGEAALDLLRRVYEYGRAEGSRQAEEKRTAEEKEEYISYAEAKKLLGKSDSTLWSWHNAKLLNKIHRGARVFYRSADVHDILSGRKTIK